MARLPQAYQLTQLSVAEQYAVVELFRGTMVSHSFIVYRNDRAGETEPITFVGDRWREYVPIRQPSTVCVRERVPPGGVAVLINRAHTYTDLILTVDAAEDRLLGAIDGKRTLAEILQVVGKGCDERRAMGFFERLWQYDQVVFDASREG